MRRPLRLAIAVICALLVAVSAAPVAAGRSTSGPPGPSERAAKSLCYAGSCEGMLPEDAHCDGDYGLRTVVSRAGLYGDDRIEVRYSPLCHAYWARYKSAGTTGSCYQIAVQIQVGFRSSTGVFTADGNRQRSGDRCAYVWTRMMSATRLGKVRWARARGGSVMSWPGGSATTWKTWSAWGRY